MATIKDVVQAAGVSITTVSHTINHTRPVSEELRERVLRAMQQLDYRPNVLARGLRMGETKTIGLIVPDNTNPFFAEIARTIESTGFQHGYSVILCNSDGDAEKQHTYVRVLATKQVDGIIFISTGRSSGDLRYLAGDGIQVVIVDRDAPDLAVDVVLVDNEQGGYDATRHLLDLGHRRIACIAGPPDLVPSALRMQGYFRALAEAELEQPVDFVVGGGFVLAGGELAAVALLGRPAPPTAIFVCNDMMAIGAIRGARACGVRVPEDLSIVGFDDIPLAVAVVPALTTIAQPTAELARLATELLLRRLQGQAADALRERIVLPARLIVRESCRALR
jgi:LacI family transcriptional regulator